MRQSYAQAVTIATENSTTNHTKKSDSRTNFSTFNNKFDDIMRKALEQNASLATQQKTLENNITQLSSHVTNIAKRFGILQGTVLGTQTSISSLQQSVDSTQSSLQDVKDLISYLIQHLPEGMEPPADMQIDVDSANNLPQME